MTKTNDIEEIKHCIDILNKGGTLLYPTDTIWGIGCDATNLKAIDKIFDIKGRDKCKSMLLLCSGFEQLSKYVKHIPEIAKELEATSKEPLSIIYPNGCNLPEELLSSDGSIGFRIPKNEFCLQLLNLFGKPIVSTSANFSGEPTPLSFSEISNNLIQHIDYTVKINRETPSVCKSSRIVKITEMNQIQIIRD